MPQDNNVCSNSSGSIGQSIPTCATPSMPEPRVIMKSPFKIVTYVTETKRYESDVLAESRQVIVEQINDNEKYNKVDYVGNDYPTCGECHDSGKVISKTVVREILRG